MINVPEFTQKEKGVYLNPIFYLSYFNILNIYRIIEPKHPMLKPLNDGKRYYSETTKDEESMFHEHVVNGNINNLRNSSTMITQQEFQFFYEEVEVENTVLLQYLMVTFGKKSLSTSYRLLSRRKRKYELAAVPIELRGVFDALGIYSSERGMKPRNFTTVSEGDYREQFTNKMLYTNQIALFHSVVDNQTTFSLAKVLAECMTKFLFYSKESVERNKNFPTGLLQITTINGLPRDLWESPRYYSDPIEKPPSLNQLLNYIQARQNVFYKQYDALEIRKELKSVINQKITNETKKKVANFFGGQQDFIHQISFSRPASPDYGTDYRLNTFNSIYKEVQTGLYGQMFACLQMRPELKIGNFLSKTTYNCYNVIRTPGMMYKETADIVPPNQLMPIITEKPQEQTEQLSLLEEGAPA